MEIPLARTYHGDARPRGVSILGAIWFVMAGLNIVVGLGATLGGGALLRNLTTVLGDVTGGALAALGIGVLVVGVLQLLVGFGLWTLRPWARTAAIVFAVVGLLSFPLGTILSIVVLVYLFQPEIRDAFEPGPEPRAGAVTAPRRL